MSFALHLPDGIQISDGVNRNRSALVLLAVNPVWV